MKFAQVLGMKISALVAIVTLCAWVVGETATMRELAVTWQSPVCHLESFGTTKDTGTGFLVLTRDPGVVLLFTAKHMLDRKDSLRITVGAYDSSGNRIALSNTWPLLDSGQRVYRISDTLQDCAWIAVDTKMLLKSSPPGYTIAAIKEAGFVRTQDLFPGLPVVFSGYPAGMSTGWKTPLSRRGSIAGIDPSTKTLLLDAVAVGGFSRSPVFLDKSQAICEGIPGGFVGLVYAKTELSRNLVARDSSTSVNVPENIGITRVVPAEVLLPSVRLFDPRK